MTCIMRLRVLHVLRVVRVVCVLHVIRVLLVSLVILVSLVSLVSNLKSRDVSASKNTIFLFLCFGSFMVHSKEHLQIFMIFRALQ